MKPGRLDKEIEDAFVRHLQGEEEMQIESPPNKRKNKKAKGQTRILVPCDIVEERVFGQRKDPDKVFGRRKNRASRVIPEREDGETSDIDERANHYEEEDLGADIINDMLGRTVSGETDPSVTASLSVRSGTRIRPAQSVSQVNGSIGGEKGRAERMEETDEMREKRSEGQRRAREREMVRCAARRGVVFGFVIDGRLEPRKCEAVRQGQVVEPSFAKGDWAIRWRED